MAARCLIRLGRANEAEPFYRNARPLDLAESHVRAYNLVNLNAPHEAVRAYQELLDRWPEDALGLKRVAAVRMGLRQWDQALAVAEKLAKLPGEAVAAWTVAAVSHHELKNYGLAVNASESVLERDPELKQMLLPHTLFWNNLALDLMASGRSAEARVFLKRALARSQDAGLMELLGLTYSQDGAIDEAEKCWRQAETWDPDNADVCLDLGRLALRRGRYDDAISFLKRAAERSADAVEPFYNLSQAYQLSGQTAEAARYLKLADQRRKISDAPSTGMGANVR